MSNTVRHRDQTTKTNNQWTCRRMARWAIGWYHALSVMRALWFGAILGILLLIQYAVANYPSPYNPYPYQSAVSSWVGFAVTLAVLTGPTIWLLGLGKKHVVREPLRGAIWIIRGLNVAFSTYFLSLTMALAGDFNQVSGDWSRIPTLSYTLAFVVGLCLWLIPFALAKPLTLRVFRDLAFCVDSIYRQNDEKSAHLYIVRLLARGQLEVDRVGDSDEYRIIKQNATQVTDRSMMQVWFAVALAVAVLGACAFVARGIKETHANEHQSTYESTSWPTITPQTQQVDTEHEATAQQHRREIEYQRSLVLAEIQRRKVAQQAEQAKAERDEALRRQRELEYQQSLIQEEMRRREAVRSAEEAARDALRLRRSWVDWGQGGNGTLVIQLANHGSRSIHINKASIQQNRWTYVAQYVPSGSTLTHRIPVRQEPIYIDLETSLGVLRFDLVPE